MRVRQLRWSEPGGWPAPGADSDNADLVLYFGTRERLACGTRHRELAALFPHAHLLGCSTGGQFCGTDVSDDEIVAVAIRFGATHIELASQAVDDIEHSQAAGEAIGRALIGDGLSGVFVLADGLRVNGARLVAGISSIIGPDIPLTGGLAGDGDAFTEALVGAGCTPRSGMVGAVGFYGSAIRIGHGSAGGWDAFGPHRRVTQSKDNVLLTLDGQPALDLYERYLDEEDAKGLPGTALLFPLLIQNPDRPEHEVVRTIVGIDRERRALIFAGDMPQGWMTRLMRGNIDRLAAGAAEAARQASRSSLNGEIVGDEVSVMVSCIGRRLLMGQRITEELEAAGREMRPATRVGFFSYGEISPHAVSGCCELHNQTMTVTALSEAAG